MGRSASFGGQAVVGRRQTEDVSKGIAGAASDFGLGVYLGAGGHARNAKELGAKVIRGKNSTKDFFGGRALNAGGLVGFTGVPMAAGGGLVYVQQKHSQRGKAKNSSAVTHLSKRDKRTDMELLQGLQDDARTMRSGQRHQASGALVATGGLGAAGTAAHHALDARNYGERIHGGKTAALGGLGLAALGGGIAQAVHGSRKTKRGIASWNANAVEANDRGRRARDRELANTIARAQARKSNVGKRERVYDAHDERQRRLGAMAGAAGITGAGLATYGTAGAVRRSRDVRQVAEELSLIPTHKGGAGGGSLPRKATRDKAGRILASRTVHLSPKHLAAGVGGLGLLGVSGELARRGRSDSNRRWR